MDADLTYRKKESTSYKARVFFLYTEIKISDVFNITNNASRYYISNRKFKNIVLY